MSTLNASQLAKEIGVSIPTVIRLFKAGKIPAEIAEGRLRRFDLAKVRAALAERAAQVSAAAPVG